MKPIIFIISALLMHYACNNGKQLIIDREPVVYKNTDSLQKIIDLSIFKPDSVAYVYKVMGDADNDSRVPGPKDYDLEAVLFYNDSTINILKGISSIKNIKELQPGVERNYQFYWMDKKIIEQVSSLKNTVEYSSEKFYKGYLPYGNYIIVGNIVLLHMYTM
jgi:hypothetical protein